MSDKFTVEQVERFESDLREVIWDGKGSIHHNELRAKFQDRIADMLHAYAVRLRDGERVTVPDGWKLVPVEPTEAMIDKGIAEHRCEQGDPWYESRGLSDTDCWNIYAAMISAAPDAMREQGGVA